MPNDNLLLAIIRRIDLDCDAQLNYLEFVDNFRPLERFMPPVKKSLSKIRNKLSTSQWNIARPKSAVYVSPKRRKSLPDFNLTGT